MLKEYPEFKIGEIEEYSKTIPNKEAKLVNDYIIYRKARGLNGEGSLRDLKRIILQIRFILEKPLTSIDLKTLREYLAVLNQAKFTTSYRNRVKTNFKNFLKFIYPDWSIRFSELQDIRVSGSNLNEERINHNTLISKQDIENLIKSETKNYWRAFLLVQYEAGLRTKEVRFLKWTDMKIDIEDGLTEINIFASKTKKARTIYVKEATHYLKLLRKEQENLKDLGTYVFHTKHNKNEPVAKYSVNEWFRKLTKRVLGRECWNYLLRHSRATELYNLAEENKISKDVAIRFMGHSEDLSKTYKHPNPDKIKKMLREQVYHIEDLPPEKKHELETKIEQLESQIKKILNFEARMEQRFEEIKKSVALELPTTEQRIKQLKAIHKPQLS